MKSNKRTPAGGEMPCRDFIRKFLLDNFPHALGTDSAHLNNPASIPVVLAKLKVKNERLKRPA